MDRDPQANIVDDEDRTTPTTGQSPYGDHGAERARKADERNRERYGEDRQADDEGRELEHKDERDSDGSELLHTPLPPD
jgi:hypothetical protein